MAEIGNEGSGGGGGGNVEVQDEGSTVVGTATALNFTGALVTATDAGGGVATVDIPTPAELPTADQKAALDGANDPSTASPFVTRQDLGAYEPNGFKDDVTISVDDGTRTITVAPTGVDAELYSEGELLTLSAPAEYQAADATSGGLLYFDKAGDLFNAVAFSDELIERYAVTVVYYYNAEQSKFLLVGRETHGHTMDSRTHLYLHNTFGAQYESGLAPGNLAVDESGDEDSHCQLSVTDGVFWDEDIKLAISNGLPQTLQPIAAIPIFYRWGTYWRQTDASQFGALYAAISDDWSGALPAWNEIVGGSGQLTEVSNNDYVLMHLFATNDIRTPIVWFCGQAEYATTGQARAGAENEINSLNLVGLPTPEFIPIGSFIVQVSNGNDNTPKARFRSTDTGADFVDWRSSGFTPGVGLSTTPPIAHAASHQEGGSDELDVAGLASTTAPAADYVVQSDGAGGLGWVAGDEAANTAVTNHEAATDPHANYHLIDGSKSGEILLANGSAASPALRFVSALTSGLYRSGASLGIAASGVASAIFGASTINLLATIKTKTKAYLWGSFGWMGGQAINDIGMMGLYDRNECTYILDRGGSVQVNITGAGVSSAEENMFDGYAGSHSGISGTDGTTTQIEIVLDMGANVSNYSNANWVPFLQWRLDASSGNIGTFYKNVVFEVSADQVTWHAPASGWSTTDLESETPLPGLWMGTLGSPGIATFRYVRWTLTDRYENAGYAFKDRVWISQIGFRHVSAPFSRLYVPAVNGTHYGDLAVTGTVDGRDVAADGSALDAHLLDTDNPHASTGWLVVTDIEPTNPGDTVDNKTHQDTANTVLQSCRTSSLDVDVTVQASFPLVDIGSTSVELTRAADSGHYSGTFSVTLAGAGDLVVQATGPDGNSAAKDTVSVSYSAPPVVTALSFSGGYPGTQTEVKAGDVFTVAGTTDKNVDAIQVENSGAGAGQTIVLGAPGTSFSESITIADRGDSTQALAARVRARDATTGAWSAYRATDELGGTTDGVDLVNCNDLYPTVDGIAKGGATGHDWSPTYPASQSALKGSESADVTAVVTDYNTIAYSDPTAAELSIPSPTSYSASKTLTRAGGTYNISTDNYQIAATRSANAATTTVSGNVAIAAVAATLQVAEATARVRSGAGSGANTTITVTANQQLYAAPTLTPAANRGSFAGAFGGGPTSWTNSLLVPDADNPANGSSNTWAAISGTNRAGIVTSAITGDDAYVVGGFTARTINFAAFTAESTETFPLTTEAKLSAGQFSNGNPAVVQPFGTSDTTDVGKEGWCAPTASSGTAVKMRMLHSPTVAANSGGITLTLVQEAV
jgi:hypothetical protein